MPSGPSATSSPSTTDPSLQSRSAPSCAKQMQDNLSPVCACPVFKEVDTLPSSERQSAVHNRYRQLHLRQGRFEVSRHVIRAFRIMLVGTMRRRDVIEKGIEINTDCGVGILLDQKGCGCVPTKYRQKTGLHLLLPDPSADGRRAFVESWASRRDFKAMRCLLHFSSALLPNATGQGTL